MCDDSESAGVPSAATDDCLDAIFEALSHPYRRRILAGLADQSSSMGVEKLLELGSADADADTLMIQLYHVHLPKLDDCGFIDWNREAETITRGDCFSDVDPLLELLAQHTESLPYAWP